MDARPHDLLFLRHAGAFVPAQDNPAWLAAGVPAVVRRAPAPQGWIAAGMRGLARNERCAGLVAVDAVARRVTPEMLADCPFDSDLPCLQALRTLAPRLRALGVAWGPAGGAGYWLATGLPVLRATSDLDLLVRLPRRPTPALLAALRALVDGQPARVDVQVDTGSGGCALIELARGGRVLLKTSAGPLLVDDPWSIEAVAA